MAEVNVIPGIQMMLYAWDKEATTPAWRPVACLETNDFNTTMTMNEVEAIVTKCGIIPAKQNPTGLGFQFTGSGFAIDTTSSGSDDLTKASHDFLLQLQRAERTSKLPDDWKLVSMQTPGIADIYGKGWITELTKTGEAADNTYQNFTFTITGVSDSLSDSTTVEA